VVSVAVDVGVDVLGSRKVTVGGVVRSAATGCAAGVVTLGVGEFIGVAADAIFGLQDAGTIAPTGVFSVYESYNAAGDVQYVGITNDIARRAAEHARAKGITIDPISGLSGNLSKYDAHGVEQALIDFYGLAKNGGTLLNRINSIARSNPNFPAQLQRGIDLLRRVGYPGF